MVVAQREGQSQHRREAFYFIFLVPIVVHSQKVVKTVVQNETVPGS